MAATVKSKRLKLSSGEIVNLGGHTLEYPASTNDLCVDKPGQQNCAGYPRAVIEGASKEKFFTHNAYGGSDDSGEFEKGVKEHYGKGYESEGESEDEGDTRVFVIDDEQIRGEEDLGSKPIPAYEWRPGKGPQT